MMSNRTDRSDRHPIPTASSAPTSKRLGSYLIEAGLLTLDQIHVILNDQQATGMRFGEIVVARGWLKEQTIEWIVEKVVEPERQIPNPNPAQPVASGPRSPSSTVDALPSDRQSSTAKVPLPSRATGTFSRRDLPIAKPLPSVNSADQGVCWVG